MCVFCKKAALHENDQDLPVCKDHKNKEMQDKRCICGEYMDVKKGRWGAFYLCPQCGPHSLSKAQGMDAGSGEFKLNRTFRQKEKEKVYTLDELEQMWKDQD